MSAFDLHGKTILITGASSGIGRSCAEIFSESGSSLMLLGRNQERLQSLKDSLEGNHKTYAFDLTDEKTFKENIGKIKDDISELHGIVHSAGLSLTYPFKLTKPEKVEKSFQTNVFSAFELTRQLLKSASKSGMSVVVIASVMASVGEKAKSVYSMTKGALTSGSRSLALELADRNIRVNCVSPGVIETPMTEDAPYRKSEEAFQKMLDKHPLGIGQPEDVAYACQFLLSDAARHITGIDLKVDGGYTAR